MSKMNSKNSSCKNILFLYGVFKKDCINVEESLEDRLLPSIDENEFSTQYDKIPSEFTSLYEWVQSTNLLCWHCDAQFETLPIFIPEYITELPNDRIIMKVRGNFCSFPCASGYNKIHTSGERRWERSMFLIRLYKIFYGKSIDEIPAAPCKTYMAQYGEKSWTREQYDDAIALSMSSHNKEMFSNSIQNIEINNPKDDLAQQFSQFCVDN